MKKGTTEGMELGSFSVKGRISALFAFPLSLLALTGCFNEPEPAYKSVPAECRLYLQERGLKDTREALASKNASVDYINLDRNALTNVDEVAAFSGLKWLRLNENRLAGLPDLRALTGLRRIYLRGNEFRQVPETLKDLPALTDIELSDNPLETVPEWLARKEGLRNLSFNRTRITKLPDDLSAWKTLHSLQLGELRLSAAEMARIRKALPDAAIAF